MASSTLAQLVKAGTSSYLQSFVLLVIRLAWGLEMYVSGHAHLQNVPQMAKRFHDWGVPAPTFNVYVSGYTEMVGGLLLMFGLGSRLISIPLVFNFIVAILTASKEKVHTLITTPGHVDAWTDIVDDAAFPFLAAALVVVAFGPGKVSIDYLLQRTLFRKSASAAKS